ncbi:MAG: sigma-54-dependent Fis family transcriptional regulator [Deltaproteobacteria bacterium]|nr:MAG: sigma-54-dependent Fis family transcriptional regulator [Deltaproteobacteria bacterium]
MKNKILLVEDDQAVRRSMEMHLTSEGFEVLSAVDGEQGVELALSNDISLVILDVRLPGIDGFEVLRRIRGVKPSLHVVVVTAFDDMQTAIEAIKLGAADHLGKPLDLGELDKTIAKLFESRNLSESGYEVADDEETSYPSHMIVGKSPAMKEVFKAIGAVVNSAATVLLEGESGTGKELAARAIHVNSPRADKPFVPVTCSVLAPSLLESEIFGHERGAFTGAHTRKAGKFEQAQGGTLFLDEISEIPSSAQVKLLRFLQEREFERVGSVIPLKADVRVIAATNRNLDKMVYEGTFRRDLYYRLNVVTIKLPPLRERIDDLSLLVQFFLNKIGRELGKQIDIVPNEVMEKFRQYRWPGNVRELENTLRRAILLSPGNILLPETLQLESAPEGDRLPLSVRSLHEVEREHIENILKYTGYEKKRAAEILEISRPTLDRRIQEYGINFPKE